MEKIELQELGGVVERVLKRLPSKEAGASLIALRGDLGAGKTTFVQALGRALGVEETMQSPTYVLMKSYRVSRSGYTKLIHIDAYRLKNGEEFAALKPELFLKDPKNLVCVEWFERVESVLPKPDITIEFSSDLPAGEAGAAGSGERYIKVV